MSRTEDRLADALTARAAAVRDDRIRPLESCEAAGSAWAGNGLGRARRRWLARLAPLAAAAAMLAAITGTVLAIRHIGRPPAPFADIGTASSPPPYYVYMDANQVLTVHLTATGHITDTRNMPDRWGGGGGRLDSALAAAADGRTFVVIYHSESPYRIGVYKFTLTSGGYIAGFRMVSNSVMPGLQEMTAAVSPDGTRVAIAGVPGHDAHLYGWTHQATEIVVVNLATGHRSTYTSRQGLHYRWLFIANLSWTNGGRDLAYLGRWCDQSIDGFNTACDWSGRSPRLRLIELSAGKFRGGPAVLRPSPRYPVVLQALIAADGRSVIAMATSRHSDVLSVVRFSALTGKPIEVLYSGRKVHDLLEAFLSADGSGRYVILDQNNGMVNGWVHKGVLHPMRLGHVLLWQAPAW